MDGARRIAVCRGRSNSTPPRFRPARSGSGLYPIRVWVADTDSSITAHEMAAGDESKFATLRLSRIRAWSRGDVVVFCDGAYTDSRSDSNWLYHPDIYHAGCDIDFSGTGSFPTCDRDYHWICGHAHPPPPRLDYDRKWLDGAIEAAPCFAISFLLIKKLTQTENSGNILVMLSIFCTLTLLPGTLLMWRTPTLIELFWLLIVAVVATFGHYALTRSIAAAPLTVTQPFSFLQLVWAIMFGYLLFGEGPDLWVCIGGAIIVGAISYMTHREAVAARREKLLSGSSMPE